MGIGKRSGLIGADADQAKAIDAARKREPSKRLTRSDREIVVGLSRVTANQTSISGLVALCSALVGGGMANKLQVALFSALNNRCYPLCSERQKIPSLRFPAHSPANAAVHPGPAGYIALARLRFTAHSPATAAAVMITDSRPTILLPQICER